MKPYGMKGKIEMAKCGCCTAHHDIQELLPWRSSRVKNPVKKRLKHKARQEAKKLYEQATAP